MSGGAQPHDDAQGPLVILVQYAKDRAACDHFAGVDRSVREITDTPRARCLHVSELDADRIGVELKRVREAWAADGARAVPAVVAVKDTQSPLALYALGVARQHGAATALLMDGIVEYRNTFMNPWVEEGFLRPAPVDLVMAMGPNDAARLASWGNRAISTGLPRLDALGVPAECGFKCAWHTQPTPFPLPLGGGSAACSQRSTHSSFAVGTTARNSRARVLVATAKRAAFNDAEFECLLEALRAVQRVLETEIGRDGVMWRLTEGLDGLLGVENDARSLDECLREASAVLTTPSTLMVEAMFAGCPTGLLHPFEGELWQRAAWVWGQRSGVSAESDAVGMLRSMLAPTSADAERQHECLTQLLECGRVTDDGSVDVQLSAPSTRTAAERVARALISLATETPRGDFARHHASKPLHSIARLPAMRTRDRSVARQSQPRPTTLVINMVSVDHSPVGGVMSWAFRLARELPRQRPEIEVRTLAVVASPEALWSRGFDLNPAPPANGTTDVCVLDPLMDAHERVEHLCEALARVCGESFAEGTPLRSVGRGSGEQPPPRVVMLPNFNDVCYMSALLTRARLNRRWGEGGGGGGGARVVAVAHTDTEYYKSLLRHYHTFDAAVGVSAACAAWLAEPLPSAELVTPPMSLPRSARDASGSSKAGTAFGPQRKVPVREIPCGVEVDVTPPSAMDRQTGPRVFRFGYIGRLVEEQKRVSALLRVARELDRQDLGSSVTGFELHVVGDGPDMARFVREAAAVSRVLRQGRIVIHGRKSLSWVESFTRTLDASVLVSTYEGTSVTMLEAMARGVVPCVTDVGSGVREWLRDGENAIVVPVDRLETMAPRLAELAREPERRARLERAAWETVRGRDGAETSANIVSTARAYAGLIDELFTRPSADATPREGLDCALVPMDTWRWPKTWCDDPRGARAWCERSLRELGYARVHIFDAARGEPPTTEVVQGIRSSHDLDETERSPVGIAFAPMLAQDGLAGRVLAVLRAELGAGRASERGASGTRAGQGPVRIAVFGTGHHTRRLRVLFERSEEFFGVDPFVGFVDDAVVPRRLKDAHSCAEAPTCFGRPVVNPDDALSVLRANIILLSSDAFEARLWARTAGLRSAGVRVIALYGPHEEPQTKATHAITREVVST